MSVPVGSIAPEVGRALLSGALDAQGLFVHAFLSGGPMRAVCAAAGLSEELSSRYGLFAARGCVAVALPYEEGDYATPAWAQLRSLPTGQHDVFVSLARFVRADWYSELSARLAAAIAEVRASFLRSGIEPGQKKDWHRVANSPLPERALAHAAGLGWIGRNGLLVAGTHRRDCAAGSAVVLGLILLPFDPEAPSVPQHARCGSCRRCIDACPTKALGNAQTGASFSSSCHTGFSREKCLQHWSAIAGELPQEIQAHWGNRLYGCDICLEACPYFRPLPSSPIMRGALGPQISARFFVDTDEQEIRSRLRGSALSLRWMQVAAFRRNAVYALHA